MSSPITQGTWTAQIVERGGAPLVTEVDFSSLSRNKLLDDSARASLSATRDECCRWMSDVEPFAHELVLYRDDVLDYAGPLLNLSTSDDDETLDSGDLFTWLDNRFVGDFHASGDLADIFRAVFDNAMALDPTPNIDITTRTCGTKGVRRFAAKEFQRAGDVMRELARSGVDFTVLGRRILAGGKEVFLDPDPLLLHDDAVLSVDISRDGSQFATDVAVFGGTSPDDDGGSLVLATGRATRSITRYGLVQKSFTELLIKDSISADANALSRLDAMQPAPIRITATIGPDAAFSFEDLIPGRRFDVRLSREVACIEVQQEMRLLDVDVQVGAEETVTIQLIPLGVGDEIAG